MRLLAYHRRWLEDREIRNRPADQRYSILIKAPNKFSFHGTLVKFLNTPRWFEFVVSGALFVQNVRFENAGNVIDVVWR